MARKKKNDVEEVDILADQLSALRKDLKQDIIDLKENYEYFLSGNPMLDAFIGSGGFPKYQLQYIWAGSSIGKSTLAIQILASYQKQFKNQIILYFDTEESVTGARLNMLGVEDDRILIINPSTIEKAEEYIKKTREKAPNADIFAIWDTVCQTPSAEEEDGYNKIGMHSKSLTGFFRRVKFYTNKLTMFALNQHRDQITANKYMPIEPPGANAIKHKSFLTMHGTSKKSELMGPEVGKCATLQTIKSKVISPKRKMIFEVTNVHGYDSVLTLVNYLHSVKYLTKKMGRFYFPDDEKGYYIDDLYRFLVTDEAVKYWKICINSVYDELYAKDNEKFKNEAKERIFNYYFKNDKFNMDTFTSLNHDTINDNDAKFSVKDKSDNELDSFLDNVADDTSEEK